jgi:hypothetical protein
MPFRFRLPLLVMLGVFLLCLRSDGAATPSQDLAPDTPAACLHPATATPPTPEQLAPGLHPYGSDSRRLLPLAAQSKQWALYSEGVNHINAWARDSDNRVWLATDSGVKCVDENADTVRHDTLQGGSGLPTEKIIAITTAVNGDIWCLARQQETLSGVLYTLCHLPQGQVRWRTVHTFKIRYLVEDTSPLRRPSLLANGRYVAITLPGEANTPLHLWNGETWQDLALPVPGFSSAGPAFGLSLVSLDNTQVGLLTPTGIHLLRLPATRDTNTDNPLVGPFTIPQPGQTFLAATPTGRSVGGRSGEEGFWVAAHENIVVPTPDAPDRVLPRWRLLRVVPGRDAISSPPPPSLTDGNTSSNANDFDTLPRSLTLHVTDDDATVWVAATYEENHPAAAQIFRFDTARQTWKVVLTILSALSQSPSQDRVVPGLSPEDWSGIPREMAAALVCVAQDHDITLPLAAFTILPTWFCSPVSLPSWPWGNGVKLLKATTEQGDVWSIEQGVPALLRRPAGSNGVPERIAPPPPPRLTSPAIRGLVVTPDGKLLVSTDLSVQRFTPGRKRWEELADSPTDLLGPITRLLATADNTVWVNGPQAVAPLQAEKSRFDIHPLEVIGAAPDGGFWLAPSMARPPEPLRLYHHSGKSGDTPQPVTIAPYPAPQTIDPGGRFFATTGTIAWCSVLLRSSNTQYSYCLLGYDTQTGIWLPPLKPYAGTQRSLPVWQVEDSEYAIVTTPDGEAMFRHSHATRRWERVALLPDDPDAIATAPPPTTVWQRQARGLTFIAAERDRFWFHQGLGVVWEFDREGRTWKRHAAPAAFFPRPFPLSGVAVPFPRPAYQRESIRAAVFLGDTLFAASESGLAAFDRRSHTWRWERLPLGIGGNPQMMPSRLTSAADFLLVQFHLSGHSVLARFDRKALRWHELWYSEGPLGPGPEGSLYSLQHDGRALWATTEQGLYRLDDKTRRWRNVATELGAPSRVPLLALGEQGIEPGKSVWVVRVNQAANAAKPLPLLLRYDVRYNRWEHFPLPLSEPKTPIRAYSQGVYGQEPDAVWFTTERGPFRFDRKTHLFTHVGPDFDTPADLSYLFVLPGTDGVPVRWFVGGKTALRLSP